MTAQNPASVRLRAAADVVKTRTEPYAGPLFELLAAEAEHAADLEHDSERCGWERYPSGSVLTRLADGILAAAGAP